MEQNGPALDSKYRKMSAKHVDSLLNIFENILRWELRRVMILVVREVRSQDLG